MRISYNWLKEYVELDLDAQKLADRLTMAGLEVEGVEYLGAGIEGVIVGRVVSVKPHPDAEKLTVCDVDNGSEVLPVVCGAKNVRAGDMVPLAMAGAVLPGGVKIKKAKLRGVTSYGMLCSERELGLSGDASGIMLLPDESQLGEDLVKAAGLDDWALEIGVTPNRPDCLSIVGIAREVAAITRRQLMMPDTRVKETGEAVKNLVNIEIEDPGLCPRYAGRVIKGVKPGPSPFWMRMRLQSVGLRSINNIVDVTNYVLMELGHPLHAFDYDLIAGSRIIVRTAADGEQFATLDGADRVLSDGMLLICDDSKPVALAGVMGGQNSEVTDTTRNIFLESAYFSPVSIRRTSKKLGMHTEASHRFERGADPEGLIAALDRAAALIERLAGGKVATGRADEYPAPIVMPVVTVRPDKVNALLGTDMTAPEMADILGRLEVSVREGEGGVLVARAPSFRPDLTREADMAEELARVFGYGRIKSVLPDFAITSGAPAGFMETASLVKGLMMSAGYMEVINYSFINPADLDRLRLPEDDFRRGYVRLQNPLTEEQSVMRTTLVPSLLANLAWNISRGVRDLKIFEVSRVFLSRGPGLPEEKLRVACICTGSRTGSLWDGREKGADFFDIKGAVETLLDGMRVSGATFRAAPEVPFLHPGKAAWLMSGGREAGFLGQLHPDVAAGYDVAAEVYVFELDLDELVRVTEHAPKFSPLPKFPAVERDVAVIVQDDVPSSAVIKAIEALRLDLVEDVSIFDYYAGKPIPKGKKSMAYNITFRSPKRTLTDEEVNAVHEVIMNSLKEKLGAEIRE